MKFSSGVRHDLVDEPGSRAAAGQPAAQARDAHSLPRRQRPARRLSASPVTAQAQPAALSRRRAVLRWRTLPLLGLAACAALLGCTSLTTPTWRVDPAYRVEGASLNAAAGYLALALQYEGENRVEQALDAYARSAQSAPDSADLQNSLGLALARHGRITAAITALRRAVVLAPDRAPLLNNLAYALLLGGRVDEASAMLKLTLAVDPAHQIALRNLAHLNEQLLVAAAKAPRTAVTAAVAVEVPVVLVASAVDTVAAPATAVTLQQRMPQDFVPWSTVAGDEPGATSKVAPLQPRPDPFSIEILNGNGVGGAAARMRDLLQEQGMHVRRVANLPPYKSVLTQVLYRPGKAEQARLIALRMPVSADVSPAPAGSTLADLRVVIGHDARRSAGCTALAVCAVAEGSAGSALRGSGRL